MAETKKAAAQAGPKHTPRTEKPRARRKTAIGYVVSDKMEDHRRRARSRACSTLKYGKIIRTTRRSRPTTRTASPVSATGSR